MVFFWLAFTPALLPRSAIFQALVAAVAALGGYGLGALLGWVVRSCGGRLTGHPRRVAWQVTGLIAVIGTVLTLWAYLRWENHLRDLVGVPHLGVGAALLTLVLAALLFVVFLAIARVIKTAGRALSRALSRVLPARVAVVVGGVVVALLVNVLVTDVAGNRLLRSLDSTFMVINDEFSADIAAPTSRHLSGGPRSTEAWDDLGRQGRVFITNAPSREQIAGFTDGPARQPVRAYVGVGADHEVDLRQEATRAVRELELAGGFDRAVINVATGTGRGWINENQTQALEYMWGGDTATVSMQYSYLPSWLSFLVDEDRSREAGRLLFNAVYARWSELPAGERPKLVVSGESLGSFGGESAFSGHQDLALRTDGALFVGPTNNNTLWRRYTAARDAGTPEVLPVFDRGEMVRFADRPEDWDVPTAAWPDTRIGYLQHANDPITWWDWSLAWHKPDWLREPRGRAVSPSIRWIPGITMLQLGADQMVANDVPPGQGHQFGQEPVYAWAKILPPPGWTTADTTRLAPVVETSVGSSLE
ncbi:alpha/beta hydrolase [Janibacter cremeus]|uniref:Putative membrane protein n=1 Tax=Janibacter cremeus TaxID=1285192 RepID=A0A852VP96_9MICO|nr:alpha/beta-hydrolase family protein [Janibacter cremeus]NYF98847.1 putative membrane protein [Janibacter cremeus]